MNKPLFYRQVVPVDKDRHRDVSIAPIVDLRFTATTNSVILLAAEFGKACREYPVVFVADQGNYFPAAVLGLQDGQNLFVGADGTWQASYVPAYVRRYPFIPALQEGGKEYLVCIDEQCEGFNREGRGERLFQDNGAMGSLLQQSMAFLQEFQLQHQRTAEFCTALYQQGLMEPMRADVALATGKKFHLDGFFVLNRQKLAALPDDTIVHMYRQGYLELIHAHLISLENFGKLVVLTEGNVGA